MKNLIKQKASFKDLYASGEKFPIDLSLSENPLGCSPNILEVFDSFLLKDCFDYPDADCRDLVKAICRKFKLKKEMIFVSNGSESIIKLLPSMFLKKGEEVIIPELTFPMFKMACEMVGAISVLFKMSDELDINMNDIVRKINKKTRLIVICNPNNPTGKLLGKDKILNLIKKVKIPIIVDEANIEFGGESVISEVSKLSNLIVLRTFSKGFGLAGLRIGFCVGNKELINNLKKVSQVFAVNRLAQKAAIEALSDEDFIEKTKKLVSREVSFLTRELRNRDFQVIDSRANNLFVKVVPIFKSTEELIKDLNKKGVSVVDGKSFGKKWKDYIRISPRMREINLKFIKVIDEILK